MKPSDYDIYLKQFQTAEDAAWSAWKEVQTLSTHVAELEARLAEEVKDRDHWKALAESLIYPTPD